MIDRLMGILKRKSSAGAATFDAKQIAAAALLVESSRIDSDYDAAERKAIRAIIADRFELSEEAATALLKAAEKTQSEVYSDFTFTETVRQSFAADERAEVVGMLWEVAYTDGKLHRFEAHMIQRVAGEIDVDPARTEEERKAALARLGLPDKGLD